MNLSGAINQARESDGSDKPLRLIAQDLSELTERRPELSGDRES